MVSAGLFYRAYDGIKQKIWKVVGTKLYKERSVFLANLLNELKNELKFSDSIRASEHFSLDIGCGIGDLTKKISEIYHSRAIGVDIDKRFVFDSGAVFLVADGCLLPFKPKAFVLITAVSLIEHIHEECRQRFYEEVSRVLEDNGIFIIQLPNRYFLIEQHSFLPLVGYLPSRLHSLFYYSYVSVPSKSETVKELIKSGFITVLVVEYGIPISRFSQKNLFSKFLPFGFIIVARKRL